MERPQDLLLAADQRIDPAALGEEGEVLGERLERVRRGSRPVAARHLVLVFVPLAGRHLGIAEVGRLLAPRDPMGEVAHHVQAVDALGLQHVDGIGVGLVEQGDQDVRAPDLLLAAALHPGRRHAKDALDGHGEARLLAVVLVAVELLFEILGELLPDFPEVGAGVLEHPAGLLVERQGVEEVLQPRVFMTQALGLGHGHGQRDLQILRKLHSSLSSASSGSVVSVSGMPFVRASSVTSATLVSATSLL